MAAGAPALNAVDNDDGDGAYTVSWSAVGGASAYSLEEDDDADFASPAVVHTGSGTTWSVPAPKLAGTYYYRVRAYGVTGYGNYGNIRGVSVLLPDVPALNAIFFNPDGTYPVVWGTAARASGYTLEEATASNFSNATAVYVGASRVWSASGKAMGTYYYRVRASGLTDMSGWSDSQSVTVSPPAVSDLRVMTLSGTSTPEYVIISNVGAGAQDMTGWRLVSVVGPQMFYFPAGYVLEAGAQVRIESYTGATNNLPDTLLWTAAAVWVNTGDKAELRDSSGGLVSSACYDSACP